MSQQPKALSGISLDISAENRARLKALFPSVFTETKNDKGELVESVDFEKLKAELGTFTDLFEARRERYGMDWPGKKEALRLIQTPSAATLKPCREESVNFDTTENLFIEGDNLEVLKLLQKSYYGKVKMIDIDPPYNTGKEFIYPDNYSESLETYLEYAGLIDGEGKKFSTNTPNEGRFHTKWLNMMYPRLYLARNLLRDDGVICIHIDDNEVSNLRKMCDEIFGEENFIANVVCQKKYAATNDAKGFSVMHDHIVVYQKSELFERILLPRTEEQNKPYKNDDNDGKGLWRSDNLLVKSFSSSGVYPIVNPKTGEEFLPTEGSCWRASKDTMKIWLLEGRIFFGKDGKGAPQLKRYLKEVQDGRVPNTWWTFEDVGHNDAANKELQSLFETKAPFDTPKPSRLIRQMLQISTKDSDIILDFFSGSATTAHAVLDLNKQDGGNRKFIMVQLPEPCAEDSEAFKAGYKTIAEIGKERIRRVIKNISRGDAETQREKEEKEKASLFSSNSSSKSFSATSAPPRETIFSIADGGLLICLADTVTKELINAVAEAEPMQFICLDKAFGGNDQLKANAVQTFNARNMGKEKHNQIIFRTV